MPDPDPCPPDPASPGDPPDGGLPGLPQTSANAPQFFAGWPTIDSLVASTRATAAIDWIYDQPLGSPTLAGALIDWRSLLGGFVLDEARRSTLNGMVSLRALRQGAAIHRRGQAATHLYAVCQGAAGVGRNSRGKADVLMQSFELKRSVQEGRWLDLHSAWLGITHDLDACALHTPTVVMEWPLSQAQTWLSGQPDVLVALMRAMAEQVRGVSSDLLDLQSKDAIGRVAAWLMRRAGPHSRFHMDERKRDVAAQLSISPETFSRMLRQLEDRELVRVAGYDINLLDRVALIRLSRDL